MSEEEIIKRLKELKEEGAILGEDEVKTLLNLIEKQDKMIDLIAEDYSKYQLRRSRMEEITETAYGIKSRIRKEVEKDD